MEHEFFKTVNIGKFFGDFFKDSPDLFAFAKNRQFQFTMMNRALLNRLGLYSFEQISGKNDFEIFKPDMAKLFREEDESIINTGKAMVNVPWSVPNAKGGLDWYMSSKYPLFNHDGEVVGLLGVMRGVNQAGSVLEPYAQLTKAILYIQNNFHKQLEMEYLAGLVNLSVSQFERNFKKLLKMTPLKFINKVRINNACTRLINSRATLAEIALDCGFYDHSYFTKIFKQQMHMTPIKFRNEYFENKK